MARTVPTGKTKQIDKGGSDNVESCRPQQALWLLLNEMGSHCVHSLKQESNLIHLGFQETLLLLYKEFTVNVRSEGGVEQEQRLGGQLRGC